MPGSPATFCSSIATGSRQPLSLQTINMLIHFSSPHRIGGWIPGAGLSSHLLQLYSDAGLAGRLLQIYCHWQQQPLSLHDIKFRYFCFSFCHQHKFPFLCKLKAKATVQSSHHATATPPFPKFRGNASSIHCLICPTPSNNIFNSSNKRKHGSHVK